MLRYLLVLIVLLFGTTTWSQKMYAPHSLRLDLYALRSLDLTGAYEWRHRPQEAIELSVLWSGYPAEAGIERFVGSREMAFTESVTIRIVDAPLQPPITTRLTEYIGPPPSTKPPDRMPTQSLMMRVGYRFWMDLGGPRSRWQWFVQPGLTVSRYQYYASDTRLRLVNQTVTPITQTYAEFTKILTQTTTSTYSQTTTMQLNTLWNPGICYDFGVQLRLGKGHRTFIEVRAATIAHPQAVHEAPLPIPMKIIQVQPQVMLGIGLGKIRSRPLKS
jgi:hypothetical protein